MFYGLGEALHNGVSLIYTKIRWHNARLVRLPFRARNRRNIKIGDGFTCGQYCRITAGSDSMGMVIFGGNFVMGDMCQIEGAGGVFFGDNVLLASRVFITSTSHGQYSGDVVSYPDTPPNERDIVLKSIKIGDNVWIGNNVSILGGVEIGNGAIIGANSVVCNDVNKSTIVVGTPAKVIKKFNDKKGCWESVEAQS